jgi:hypothetical protein
MFKGYQDTSNQSQFKGFPNLNMQGAVSAYGFSGVSFWLDAAYGLNTQTNLGAVSSWQQRVGGGTFTQGTAGSQPRLILSDANYNGYPSVEAVDGQRFMITSNGLRLNVNGITLVVVSKINTATQGNSIIGNDVQNYIWDGGTAAGFVGFGFRTANINRLQGNTETTNPRIKILTGNNIIIVNGTNETVSGTIGDVSIEFTRLFNILAGSVAYIGTIAEIIAFPYSMTSTDAIALSDRINQKYALY